MSSREPADIAATFALVGQLGLIMAGSILAGLLVGLYVDRLLGTGYVMSVVLLLIGIGGGMVAVYRLVMKAITARSNEEEQTRDQGDSR